MSDGRRDEIGEDKARLVLSRLMDEEYRAADNSDSEAEYDRHVDRADAIAYFLERP